MAFPPKKIMIFFPKILWMGVFACFLQSCFCKCIPVRRIYWVLGFLLYLGSVDRLVRCSLCFWHRHVGPASMRPTLLSTSRQGRAETGCFGISSPSRWKMGICISVPSPSLHAHMRTRSLSRRSRNRPHFFSCSMMDHVAYISPTTKKNKIKIFF